MNIRKTAMIVLVAGALFALAGCSDDPVSPGIEPEIINGTESFEFQVSAVSNASGSWSYTWDNASATASIDNSSSLSGGSATLTIADADGSVVYQRAMGDGSFETGVGTAGDWRITVTLNGASGDLNFRVDEGS